MSGIGRRLLPLLLLLVLFHPSHSVAQQRDSAPNLNLGDAVVTGFSGTIVPNPAKPRPPNKSVVDLTFIDPDGPAARIVRLAQPGFIWDGRMFAAPKTFDVLAKDVGQVFGVALDDATPPNIYLAATSLFGLNLVGRDRTGALQRLKKGGPSAGWMKAQFGLDLQGSPGAIYKVDGRTGAVTLFANVTLDGVPNPAPGLGNLAYDSAHKQLFVSDLYTGMIHRFDLDGHDLGRYDHGVTALAAAKLATVAFDPKNRPNIASASFDSEKPDTWGFAPATRRVWALAVHDGRLYYSVLSGPKIWSVGIAPDGGFAGDARWELDVPAQAGPLAVSDIAFSQKGAMILAQRARIAASYDYSAFTQPGQPQVLRFWLKDPNDPPSPGRWKLIPEEYAVGFNGDYHNSNGGVALGYGYDEKGMLSTGACENSLWTTGQNLRNNPALRSQLEPGGPLVVNGLQGNPADLVRPANAPPAVSYFVDYDDKFDDQRATGHLGSVRIYTTPCAPSASAAPVAEVTPTAAPGGCVGPDCRNVCTPTCICPPGTVLQGKECVKTDACPPPMIPGPVLGQCICPPGTVLVGKECVPRKRSDLRCPPPFVPGPTPDSCVCPPGTVQQGHTCVPLPHECQPPLVLDPVTHTCVCPPGTVQQGRRCVPQVCPSPLVPGPCECPRGTVQQDGLCVKGTPIDLTIEKENTPKGGGGTWFNLTVGNVGPPITFQAGELTVKDNIPAGMTVTSVTGTNWTCGPPPPPPLVGPATLTCTYNLAGSLGSPQAIPDSIYVDYTTTGPGPFVNCATISVPPSVGVDNNPQNDTSCVTVTPTDKKIDVAIAKTGGTTPVCRVGAYAFHITVTNGPNPWPGTGNIVVTDTVPANMTFAAIVSPPWSCLPAGPYAAGTTFTCTYNGPAPTANQVLPPINISATATIAPPFPPYTNCASVSIPSSSGYVDSNSANNNACVTVAKPASCSCPAPQVINADGRCVCPPPMVTGATPNTCVCPQGMTLVDGKCVPVEICKPPLVMIPGAGCRCPDGGTLVDGKCVQVDCKPPLVMIPGVGCRCPDGGVLVDGKCVKKIVCDPPLVPNADGTKCVCRDGLVLRRGKCVEVPKPKREQTCKRDFVFNGETCVRRKVEPKEERSRELPSIRLPGLSPGGPSRDTGRPGTR